MAPDATLYIVPDEAALQRVARAREPPLGSAMVANLRQLLQWTPKPAGRTKHRDESDNWQLLSSVVWAGQGPYSVRIAMVASGATSSSSSTGRLERAIRTTTRLIRCCRAPPGHLDGWQLVEPPEAVQHLKDGSSLAGHWACLANPPATQPAEVCFPAATPRMAEIAGAGPNFGMSPPADAHVRDRAHSNQAVHTRPHAKTWLKLLQISRLCTDPRVVLASRCPSSGCTRAAALPSRTKPSCATC